MKFTLIIYNILFTMYNLGYKLGYKVRLSPFEVGPGGFVHL